MTVNKCPVCGKEMNSEDVMNSLSRLDNKTYICNGCGTAEAYDSTHSLAALLIKALKERDLDAFEDLVHKFPALPISTMKAVNEAMGKTLFEF